MGKATGKPEEMEPLKAGIFPPDTDAKGLSGDEQQAHVFTARISTYHIHGAALLLRERSFRQRLAGVTVCKDPWDERPKRRFLDHEPPHRPY